MIGFRCPQCNKKLKAPPSMAKRSILCPRCQHLIMVPEAEGESSQASDPSPLLTSPPPPPPPPPTPSPVERPVRKVRVPAVRRRKHVDDDDEIRSLTKRGEAIDMEELVDVTAMVDIVFFLLIFFLVTSMAGILSSAPLPHLESQSDESSGKASQKSEDREFDSQAIVVNIGKDDSIEIDGVNFRDIGDVANRLRQLRATGGPETSVMIKGHGDATHGTTVAVLDAGYEAGINHLRLAVVED